MTPTRTVDDLRDAMEYRVAGLAASPHTAARVIALDTARRRRRRIAGAVVLATAVAAIAIPFAIGADDQGTIGPSVDGPPVPDGWTSELPGLDLPEGDPLTVPFRSGDALVMDGQVVALDSPLEVSSFLTVPDGVVVERGTVPGSEFPFATRLELIRADGSVEVIDSGLIAGVSGARMPDGSVVLAYGWLESPDADRGEVRVRAPGSDEPSQVIPVRPPVAVDPGRAKNEVATGRVLVFELGGMGELLELELATGRLEPDDETRISPLALTADGLDLRFDTDRECVVARSPDSAEVWSLCEPDQLLGLLSPDGTAYVTLTGAYDTATGEQVASFPLPGLGHPQLPSRQRFMGWETSDTVLFAVSLGRAVDDYVAVRCKLETGACERVPHPVDMIGQYAR